MPKSNNDTNNEQQQIPLLRLDVEDLMNDWERMITFETMEYYRPDLSQTNISNSGSSPTCVSPTITSSSSSSSMSSLKSSMATKEKRNVKYNLDNVQFRAASPSPMSTFTFSTSAPSGRGLKFHETRFASKSNPNGCMEMTKSNKRTNNRTTSDEKDNMLKLVFHNIGHQR